jgi:carbon monoxide dehydrogenase subunit G
VTVHLDHEFTVPVPPAQAWPVLLDVERTGPCLPGATITKVDGRDFEGKVKVKVGPITVTYGGAATFTDIDDDQHRAVIVAKGKEVRGAGTANATIITQLHDQGGSTRVTVHTELAITGRPAQFGRGMMADVGTKLLGRFADCLAGQLSAEPEPEPEPAAEPATPAQEPAEQAVPPATAQDDALDLLEAAGGPILKRLAPAVAVLVLLAVLLAVLRRRGHD